MTAFVDKTLVCRDCGSEFTFAASEQEFFNKKGLVNEPKRCSGCRLKARAQRAGSDTASITQAACAACGALTSIPFQPKGYKPVYCSPCFHQKKQELQTVEQSPIPDSHSD